MQVQVSSFHTPGHGEKAFGVDPQDHDETEAQCDLAPEPDATWLAIFASPIIASAFPDFPPSVYKIEGARCSYHVVRPHWQQMRENLRRLVHMVNLHDNRNRLDVEPTECDFMWLKVVWEETGALAPKARLAIFRDIIARSSEWGWTDDARVRAVKFVESLHDAEIDADSQTSP